MPDKPPPYRADLDLATDDIACKLGRWAKAIAALALAFGLGWLVSCAVRPSYIVLPLAVATPVPAEALEPSAEAPSVTGSAGDISPAPSGAGESGWAS